MAQINKVRTRTITDTVGSSVTNASRSANWSVEITSPPTSGSFITFPDGSKFRRPTSYSKRTYSLQPGQGQSDSHLSPTKVPLSIRSGSGGYRDDDLMGSNCPDMQGIAMRKLYENPLMPQLMLNEAVTRALNEIADQKANIGETLATFRQTVGLFASPCQSLFSSLKQAWNDKDVRPWLFKTARDIQREGITTIGAKKYLEYVYGWKPLMSDIYGVSELLKEQGTRPLLLSGKGVANQQTQLSQRSYTNVSNTCVSKIGPLSERVKVSCKIYGRIDPNTAGLRTLNQLGLLNPASLAWELVRWSFVIDWFVPIGPVLNALSAPAGLVFVGGTRSLRVSASGPYTHANDKYRKPQNSVQMQNDANGTVLLESYERSTYNSWPLPMLYYSRDPFSGDRPLKALALAIGSLRGLRI